MVSTPRLVNPWGMLGKGAGVSCLYPHGPRGLCLSVPPALKRALVGAGKVMLVPGGLVASLNCVHEDIEISPSQKLCPGAAG